MPNYEFEAMDATGMEIKDVVFATSEKEVQEIVRGMGYFVTKVMPCGEGESPAELLAGDKTNIWNNIGQNVMCFGITFAVGVLFGFLLRGLFQ